MLTTLSRRSASASRRASSRLVFRCEAGLQLGLARIDDTDARSRRLQRIHERPRRPTRFDRDRLRAAHAARDEPGYPSAVRGNRPSHFRSPVGVMAHAWKKRLVQINTDILSIHGLSSSHSPEHAWFRASRIISGAATERRPFHLIRENPIPRGGRRDCRDTGADRPPSE